MILANWRGLFEETARSTCTIRFAKVSGLVAIGQPQRRALNLGELNTTQIERWQRSIEVIEQEGQTRQDRLLLSF